MSDKDRKIKKPIIKAGCFSPIDIDYNTEPKRWVDVIPQEAWLFSKSYHKAKK